jgi:Tfp pilus assembly protein PilZ
LIPGIACTLHGEPLQVYNLSVGGLFAATDRPPLPGQVVELMLSLNGQPAFPLVGQVTWINDPGRPRAPELPRGFGVKITRVGLRDRITLLDVLRRASALTRKT